MQIQTDETNLRRATFSIYICKCAQMLEHGVRKCWNNTCFKKINIHIYIYPPASRYLLHHNSHPCSLVLTHPIGEDPAARRRLSIGVCGDRPGRGRASANDSSEPALELLRLVRLFIPPTTPPNLRPHRTTRLTPSRASSALPSSSSSSSSSSPSSSPPSSSLSPTSSSLLPTPPPLSCAYSYLSRSRRELNTG